MRLKLHQHHQVHDKVLDLDFRSSTRALATAAQRLPCTFLGTAECCSELDLLDTVTRHI